MSDKIFQTLDKDLSTYIADRQGESVFRLEELAKQCDIYFTSKCISFEDIKTKMRFVYQFEVIDCVHRSEIFMYAQLILRKYKNTGKNKIFSSHRSVICARVISI